MSKRTKFALLIWLGPDVSVLKKARMSTDRALVKQIIQVRRRHAAGLDADIQLNWTQT